MTKAAKRKAKKTPTKRKAPKRTSTQTALDLLADRIRMMEGFLGRHEDKVRKLAKSLEQTCRDLEKESAERKEQLDDIEQQIELKSIELTNWTADWERKSQAWSVALVQRVIETFHKSGDHLAKLTEDPIDKLGRDSQQAMRDTIERGGR